jgi:hypothetical protein
LVCRCEMYDPEKAKLVALYIDDDIEGEKKRQKSIKQRNAGPDASPWQKILRRKGNGMGDIYGDLEL